jgi:hypothetical protein
VSGVLHLEHFGADAFWYSADPNTKQMQALHSCQRGAASADSSAWADQSARAGRWLTVVARAFAMDGTRGVLEEAAGDRLLALHALRAVLRIPGLLTPASPRARGATEHPHKIQRTPYCDYVP